MENLLEVRNLKKSFGKLCVLEDISFNVEKGKVVAIIGPSGSGKSTLLRCLTQLERADSGEVTVCGEEMLTKDGYRDAKTLREIRLKTGLVFQNFNLFPHFSVLRNITEAPVRVLKRGKAEAKQNAMELLKKMGLETKADSYPCELSGGQQQRVAIARALATDPEIIYFDEPTSALDPELTGEVLSVMRKLAEEGMTMLVVTHEMGFARNVSSKTVFMENGVVVEQAPSQQFFASPKEERTRAFLRRIAHTE